MSCTSRSRLSSFAACPPYLLALLLGVAACGGSDEKASDEDKVTDPSESTAASDAGGIRQGDGRVPNTTTPGKCESGSFDACSSFVTPFGSDLSLGKYGAIMEPNVGAAFKNMVSPLDTNVTCSLFASVFGQDPAQTNNLLDLRDLDLSLYTVYRPAKWVEGEKYPIITWGNGTCAQPEGYGALLRYVASQGFFVVAANSRYASTDNAQLHALDFAFAENADPKSPYYGRLDTTRVAAMGHSQGAGSTVTTSKDERVKTMILFNGGGTGDKPKPFLTISGDRDIGGATAASLATLIDAWPKAAYLFYHMIPGSGAADGHLTLMTQPERVIEPTVAWLRFQLQNDQDSAAFFVGETCKLCGHDADYEYGAHGL